MVPTAILRTDMAELGRVLVALNCLAPYLADERGVCEDIDFGRMKI